MRNERIMKIAKKKVHANVICSWRTNDEKWDIEERREETQLSGRMREKEADSVTQNLEFHVPGIIAKLIGDFTDIKCTVTQSR